MNTQEYFKKLEKDVREVYEVAEKARNQGLDPVDKVEIPLARSLAEKVVGLISTVYPQLIGVGIEKEIIKAEKEWGKLNTAVAFKVAEQIARQKFCKFPSLLEAIDAGIRVGFCYITLGVVSSPIEGYTKLELGKTRDGKEYFKAYFSGPVRSAGTTASCVALMLINYLREIFGFAKYDPTEDEIKRYYIENHDYHTRVTNLQYMPTEEEILYLAKNLPIQIAGDPTEKREVSNYKNLERVESNFIRGGMCLVFSEGLAQKAKKGMRLLKGVKEKGFESTGWDFLEDYIKLHEERDKGKKADSPTYINDLVAGRPIFGHPSKSGGFRFRYGRGRNSGFSANAVHPATMTITDGFIANGTQLKIEKPTKGCIATSCDSIEGPIVKLFNGSVRKLDDFKEAKKLYSDVEEIIYLGDFLVPFSDVANRNSNLIKPGYVEEWWGLELREKDEEFSKEINFLDVDFEKAVEISKKYGLALYPKFIYYWTEISKEQFSELISWLREARINKKIILPFNKSEKEKFEVAKRALELLGVEHEVSIENVIINKENSKALFANLGLDYNLMEEEDVSFHNTIEPTRYNLNEEKSVLDFVNDFSEFIIKDKAGTFIGSRMGRPEKAKLRKLTGSPNVLFPVGKEGGRLRSIQEACSVGKVRSAFPIFYCEECKNETIYAVCESCGNKCKPMYYSPELGEKVFNVTEKHGKVLSYWYKALDINHYLDKAREKIGITQDQVPALIKGVRGLSSSGKQTENLAKGILRAKYNLQVNKDGTIRFDGTEIPLVSFKPKEISVSMEKLKEIGYDIDIHGKELVDEEQILELKPHDIILPCVEETHEEPADEVFIKVCHFIDDLLRDFYKLDSFYNINKKEDLVGQLGVFMAPHNCAGVICRFIGFSNNLGILASPYMHAAVRRDCVHPKTNFVYLDNNFIHNEEIGEYVENLIKNGASTKKIDSYGTIRVDIDKKLYAFGVDPTTKKVKKKKIKYFVKGPSPKKWVKMKTSSGREQIMTPTHKFIHLDEKNNFKIKRASEIKKGDKIAVLKDFNINSKLDKIFLPKLLSEKVPINKQDEIRVVGANLFFRKLVKKIGEKKMREILKLDTSFKNLFDWYNLVPLNHVARFVEEDLIKWEDIPSTAKIRTVFNNKEWDLVFKIDESLMAVLGYYSAEGHSRQTKSVSQICFRIMDENQRKKLSLSIKNAFGLKPSFGENKTKITICNKLVYYLFEYCFEVGKGAYEKKVPNIIFNVSDNLAKTYLSCYLDSDGTIFTKYSPKICFYSVSKKLLEGVALLGCRFGLFGRFRKTQERLPGKRVLERYKELGKSPKKHVLYHLVYSGRDFYKFIQILKPSSKRKLEAIKSVNLKDSIVRKIKYDNQFLILEKLGNVFVDIVRDVEFVKEDKNSYCFDVESTSEEDKNVLWGEQIINFRCDGDEAAIMLLSDVLLNFSRKFLPSHRGGTQDAPLVLNAKIDAGEVDDQILDFELLNEYPIELYRLSEEGGHHSSEIKFNNVELAMKNNEDPFVNIGFTHNTNNLNDGVSCSTYKTLPTMKEKVEHQMALVEKIRAADTSDTARLIIEKHFIRDMRGNLRSFSTQSFRCVGCNEIVRRPPLKGKCPKCGGKLIFTIHEGGIKKYLNFALELTEKYDLSLYLQQNIQLIKRYIDSIFGKELEKQEKLEQWF